MAYTTNHIALYIFVCNKEEKQGNCIFLYIVGPVLLLLLFSPRSCSPCHFISPGCLTQTFDKNMEHYRIHCFYFDCTYLPILCRKVLGNGGSYTPHTKYANFIPPGSINIAEACRYRHFSLKLTKPTQHNREVFMCIVCVLENTQTK